MGSVPPGWLLEQAKVRLELIDAAIAAYRISGDHDVASKLMSIRELAAEKAAALATEAAESKPSS